MAGESDEPISAEDYPETPRANFPTFVEWAAENAEQIIKSAFVMSGSSSSTLYTVPKNKTLYITSAHICLGIREGNNAISSGQGLEIYPDNLALLSFLPEITNGVNSGALISSNSVSYPMPLKVEAGKAVRIIKQTNNCDVAAGFQGFLLNSNISISQIR